MENIENGNIRDRFNVKTKEFTVSLSSSLNAKIVLERAGYELPSKGDQVIVKATICLPSADNEGNRIHPEIAFGQRLKVCGETLHDFWGERHGPYRQSSAFFKSSKWSEAFREAEDWAMGQINKLVKALEARQKAFEDAEFI